MLSSAMAKPLHFVFLIFASLSACAISKRSTEPYVVYMGSKPQDGDHEAQQAAHLQMLSSVIPRQDEEKERVSLMQSYHHAFKGFSAMLTGKEAALLSGFDEVVSVFPDRILQLHTTRSWDFLDTESGIGSQRLRRKASSDVIIGIIDTGVWPESPSFNDAGMGRIPSRWKGICMEGSDFKKYNCNRKLIGARYYTSQAESIQPPSNGSHAIKVDAFGSPRDSVGHGTHTSSTAAGSMVPNASYYGLAQGVAKGGSPSSRLAVYKACSLGGCAGSTVMKAIDDAIDDGVDMISISIGMSSVFQSDFLSDPIAIGAFHAHQRGVLVICSGGNDGPDPYTVVNSAPWILTVAASSIDRNFQSTIGTAINFSNLNRSESYPLVFGGAVAAESTPISEASNCYPGSLDADKAAGKIIVCVDTDPTVTRRIKKLVAEGARAKGLILVDEAERGVPFDSGSFPFSEVENDVGVQILKYINSTKKPSAVILPAEEVKVFKPAPVVAYFSARGPGGLTEAILKGTAINFSNLNRSESYPLVFGGAVAAESTPISEASNCYPGSLDADKAAGKIIVCVDTDPTVTRRIKKLVAEGARAKGLILVDEAERGVPFDSGSFPFSEVENDVGVQILKYINSTKKPSAVILPAEEVKVFKPAPVVAYFSARGPGGLTEAILKDYLHFLCYYGYKNQAIRSISGTSFSCPSNASPDLISNLNYPSTSIAKLGGKQTARTVSRIVTNVGPPNSTYTATVDAPSGLIVKVSPERLVFTKRWMKATYQVTFDAKAAKDANIKEAPSYDVTGEDERISFLAMVSNPKVNHYRKRDLKLKSVHKPLYL
ncbi:hypothetical protein C4D60_Mb03t09070 [Musa balbisiana]|uniref:Subtilisin-like protease fibronectin type-III domain-containing protein n=1 Tax=Musa balbisiana TaxID=52838 RepID=A0A4S8J8K4_MUSBA|nr:hypothetical protein C4D60_Mb03t09070 [Musa balbisiana]